MTAVGMLLDLVLPSSCAGCRAHGGPLCAGCARELSTPFRVRRAALAHGPAVYTLGDYAGPARRIVLAYKERGRRELAAPLARLLASTLPGLPEARADGRGVWHLVPVPSRPAAARARGGQHMLRLVRRCAAALAASGVGAVVHPALRLDRRTRDSVGLGPVERAANLAGRLRHVPAAAAPVGTPLVLLDDVVTTGATIAACCSALAAAGQPVAAVLTCTAAGGHDETSLD